MARYIDAEALTAEFKRLTLGENSLVERMFADGVYAVIDTFPTADVVPKSEVEKIFEEIEKLISSECLVIKDENGIKGYVDASVHYAIAELKKKYTERKESEN